jgi:GPCR proteolysis site, GPS, motif
MQIIVPKTNQYNAEIEKNYKCVTWNSNSEKWDETGIIKNMTLHCQNYIVCYTTHLSDFTVVIDDNAAMDNHPVFDSYALETNAAWWLSIGWFSLFLLLTIYNVGKYSLVKPTLEIK